MTAKSRRESRYCAWCGADRHEDGGACPACGHIEVTPEPPSQEPCAYCGVRPTWRTVWTATGEQQETLFLCAACDEREAQALERVCSYRPSR